MNVFKRVGLGWARVNVCVGGFYVLCGSIIASELVTWDVQVRDEEVASVLSRDAYVSSTAISPASGLSVNSTSSAWRIRGFDGDVGFLEFAVTVSEGKEVVLNSLTFGVVPQAGSGGEWTNPELVLEYSESADFSVVESLGVLDLGPSLSSGTTGSLYLASSSTFFTTSKTISSGETCFFRLRATGAEGAPSRNQLRFDPDEDFVLGGDVVPSEPGLIWNGQAGGVWDTSELNFLKDGIPSSFTSGEGVTIDAAASIEIDSGGISSGPLWVEVFSSDTIELFGGAVSATSLVKSGGSSLEISLPGQSLSTGSGDTIVAGGVVRIIDETSYFTGGLSFANGGELRVDNGGYFSNTGVTSLLGLQGGIFRANSGTKVTLAEVTADSYGASFVKQGTGTLSVNGEFGSYADAPIHLDFNGGTLIFSGANRVSVCDGEDFSSCAGTLFLDGVEFVLHNLTFGLNGQDAPSSGTIVVTGSQTEMTSRYDRGESRVVVDVVLESDLLLTSGSGDNDFYFDGGISGTGSIVKEGNGELYFEGSNSYTGNTTVLEGSLSVSNPDFGDLSTVRLEAGTSLILDFLGTDTIEKLYLDGQKMDAGIWGGLNSSAPNQSAFLEGQGLLSVQNNIVDSDNDGLPDSWESFYGLNPFDNGSADPANGAAGDPDGDGLTNFTEYQLGFSPVVAGLNPGRLTRDTWNNVEGSTIGHLTNLETFPLSPDSNQEVSSFELVGRIEEGTRLRGYLEAPATGSYQFWIAANNTAELWLSDGTIPANRVVIARVDSATSSQAFDDYPAQESVSVDLVGGEKYYFEVLNKQDLDSSHISVAWNFEGGARELLSFEYLYSMSADSTDGDDDLMSDVWELANGFPSPDSAEFDETYLPYADPDDDYLPNYLEAYMGTDPFVRNSLPGALTEELWTEVTGANLSDLYEVPKFAQGADMVRLIGQSEATRYVGNHSAVRVRGYIEAPVSGDYYFWLSGDDEVKFWLSTDDSKFNKELLIAPKYFVSYQRYDAELSQQSRLVTLQAGEKYYMELQWKENTGGGASPASLAWQIPDGERELVSSSFLHTYEGSGSDLDDDDLLDSWESTNGLNPNDSGSIDPANGYFGDLDGDGLLNYEEFAAGTRADLSDTDGDGVDDLKEVKTLETNALVGDVAPFQLEVSVQGSSFTSSEGEWGVASGSAFSRDVRGWLEYDVSVPSDGVYLLELEVSPRILGDSSNNYPFIVSIDGVYLDRLEIEMDSAGNGLGSVLTPWLDSGIHSIRIFNDNSLTSRRLMFDGLSLYSAQGSDSSGDGIPDWVNFQLTSENGISSLHTTSKVSPAPIEGLARYFDLLTFSGGETVIPIANGGWSLRLPLSSQSGGALQVDFESGGHSETIPVSWVPTNLLEEDTMFLKSGDALLMTAFTGSDANGSDKVWLTIEGTTYYFKGNTPLEWIFPSAGDYVVDVLHRRGNGNSSSETTHQVTVRVFSPVAIESPIVVPGHVREWIVPAMSEELHLEFDDGTMVIDAQEQLDGSTRYLIVSDTLETRYAHVRLGEGGAVLQSIPIRGFHVRDAEDTGLVFVEDYEDGSFRVDMGVVIAPVYPEITINYNIFVSGVTFDTGGIDKDYPASDFDSLGQAVVSFIKTGNAASACHITSVYQGGTRIAKFF